MLILAPLYNLAGSGLGKSQWTETVTQGWKGKTKIYVDDTDNPFWSCSAVAGKTFFPKAPLFVFLWNSNVLRRRKEQDSEVAFQSLMDF